MLEFLKENWWITIPLGTVVLIIVLLTLLFLILDLCLDHTESDAEWYQQKKEKGWEIDKKQVCFLRLPGIRRFRFCYHLIKSEMHRRSHGAFCLQEVDEWLLYAIFRGFC